MFIFHISIGIGFWGILKRNFFSISFGITKSTKRTNIFSNCGHNENVEWKRHSQTTIRPACSKIETIKPQEFFFQWEMRWKNWRSFGLSIETFVCKHCFVWCLNRPLANPTRYCSMFNYLAFADLFDFSYRRIVIPIAFDSNFISNIQ